MQHQDSLPSTDEVTAIDKNDPSRLPSYRETRRYRYHPYSRPIPVLVDEADRLLVRFPSFFSFVFTDCTVIQNTIYDDECVVLDVPPLPARVVTVESIHFFGDLVFIVISYSTPFCHKVTILKNVSVKIWNVPLHLSCASNVFPQSSWSVFPFLFTSIFS